jgi:bis(5'-nucleosyl)-tetraphosphatase (symmetrical)
MATYAIGDVQGCFSALERLVEQIAFDPARDRLWFVGDLVNRGPESARVLRYVKDLTDAATTVLGNHDLFLIAAGSGLVSLRPKDTIGDVLAATDRDELIAWLRHQKLLHRSGPFSLVHAGLLPQWTVEEAALLASEVEAALRGPDFLTLLRRLYPASGLQWAAPLQGTTRLAAVATVLTRLRTCSSTGLMEHDYSGPPAGSPAGFLPWFDIPGRQSQTTTIVCGHWAALGLHLTDNILALDSGCVWGRKLTAVRLEDRAVFQTACGKDE